MSDDILDYIKNTVDRIEVKQDKHDERLGSIERWQSDANGKISMIGVIGVAIGGAVTAVITYFRH